MRSPENVDYWRGTLSLMLEDEAMQKTLVLILGPPAVGKMTVGLELSRLTGRVVFAELAATLDARVERNRHPARLAAKRSKRDVDGSERRLLAWEDQPVLNSGPDTPFPFQPHLHIDNTDLTSEEAARRVMVEFDLCRRRG